MNHEKGAILDSPMEKGSRLSNREFIPKSSLLFRIKREEMS
jgi:hypothetical protein